MRSAIVVCVGTLLAAPAALAQDWDWQFTPYLWAAGIDGDVALGPTSRPVDIEAADIFDVLAGAALVHVETASDENVIFGDLVWLSLEPDDEVQLDSTIIELGYARRLDAVGLEFGLRYWDFELEIDPALTASVTRDDSWTDGFVGIRTERSLGDNWVFESRFNIGAGGADSTFGVQLDFGREFQSENRLTVGLKVLDIDYEEESVNGISFVLDTMFIGGTIGFRFD